ncbi:choice-of-anchor M domain-containing protein [Akkermansiaceae bacterium]|nr:choice-of-anchor M domain-containing protein [Akkermansiaceae bacterium]MDA7869797.1 choice-of-anchor M domain-containing protein [Akkermansiaceae bacterium]MDB4436553.1 choice-of-anchor M domain-containing protein [Akkermansiaceae bacterium]MDB4684143.1 choice-of-anchor M domain-containing protein [Akkermansiaceae bacterium]MDB4719549.1 choice-of-anchor M domain-containing protein [Akkermansiaceae bacterium]
MVSLQSTAREFDLLYGHHEIQTDYDPVDGWSLVVSYNLNDDFNDRTQIRRLKADQTTLIAPPLSKGILPNGFSFLADPGETVWVLPQGFDTANHFLGMRVIADAGIFQTRVGNNYSNIGRGTISFALKGATGSGPDRGGHFAHWESLSLGGSEVYLSSRDGIDESDEIPTLPAGAHSHFNWAFSKPGNYFLEFEVAGRLRAGGQETSHRETFHFQVPHSGELAEINASLCFHNKDWTLNLRDPENGVLYGPRRALVVIPDSNAGGGFSCPCSFDAIGSNLPDRVGLPEILAQSGAASVLTGPVSLRLIEHIGPGEVSFGSHFQSTDGLTTADLIDLTSPTTATLNFTEPGIHTLAFQPIHSTASKVCPLIIRCLAGLGLQHSFTDWADSYERAYDLPAGSLTDPSGDWNRDGNDHQMEFLLDAAGADPIRGNPDLSHFLPRYDTNSQHFTFFRDLTKDPLDNAPPNLLLSYSSDLVNWRNLGPRNRGRPLQYAESGAEEGNAVSPFIRRSLFLSPIPTKSFFRLIAE